MITTARIQAHDKALSQLSLLDQLGTPVLGLDPAGCIVFWNQAAAGLFQWPAREVIGKAFVDVLLPPGILHQAMAEEILLTTLEQGDSWAGDLAMQRKNWTLLLGKCNFTAVKDARGRVLGLAVTATDDTDRQVDQDRLQEDNNCLRQELERLRGQLRILRQERLRDLPAAAHASNLAEPAVADLPPGLHGMGPYVWVSSR